MVHTEAEHTMDMTDDRNRNLHAHACDFSGASAVNGNSMGSEMCQNMLVEIFRAVPRMQAQLEHIEESVDSTRTKVDDLSRKVEDLTSWKNRILGGVAVLAFLWAGMKLVSDYVHVSVGKVASTSASIAPHNSRYPALCDGGRTEPLMLPGLLLGDPRELGL
jgi:hypothetical protein